LSQILKLLLEVETIKPDTPAKISELIQQAVNESIIKSNLEETSIPQKPAVVFERHLPTTEQLHLLVATIQLVITTDPLFFERAKSFFDLLFLNNKFKEATPSKINVTLSIGDKKIEVKNCDSEDTIKIIMKEYEVLFKPRH
jgi:hypothetical protein